MSKIIGIVGTRRRNDDKDFQEVWNVFRMLYKKGDKICSGGCKSGGDRFAEIIASRLRFTEDDGNLIIHRPKPIPKNSPKYMYAKVNYERNTLVANDSDVLIACVSPDRTGGTEDTIKKFLKNHDDGNLVIV